MLKNFLTQSFQRKGQKFKFLYLTVAILSRNAIQKKYDAIK